MPAKNWTPTLPDNFADSPTEVICVMTMFIGMKHGKKHPLFLQAKEVLTARAASGDSTAQEILTVIDHEH